MVKKLLWVALLSWSFAATCQPITTSISVIPDHLTLSGTVGQYPINMNLFLYQKDKTYGTGKRMVGTYQYLKTNVPIDLVGEIYLRSQLVNGQVQVTEVDLILFELNEEGQKAAKFVGTIKGNTFTGSWQKTASSSKLTVTMRKTSVTPLKRTKNAVFEVNTGSVSYALNLGGEYDCIPKLDTTQSYSDGEAMYVLTTFSYATNCQCRNRGSCGCGVEQYVAYLVASITDYHVLEYAVYNVHSCANAIESSFFQDGRAIDVESIDLHTFKDIAFEVYDIQNDKETSYVLAREKMVEGFLAKPRSPRQ